MKWVSLLTYSLDGGREGNSTTVPADRAAPGRTAAPAGGRGGRRGGGGGGGGPGGGGSPLRWPCKSLRRLATELTRQGHRTSHRMVAVLLRQRGYSLQANRK